MYDLSQLDRKHVNFKIFREIFGQTLHFNIRRLLLNHSAAQFDAGALLFVNEVQRHVDLDCLVHAHSQEVSVHGESLRGVALDVLDDGILRLAADINLKD